MAKGHQKQSGYFYSLYLVPTVIDDDFSNLQNGHYLHGLHNDLLTLLLCKQAS
jgi:hypothetical protein